MTVRKGSKTIKDIPKEILDQLNSGLIETVNLVEWLAVDQRLLLKNFLIKTNRSNYLMNILNKIDLLKKQTVNTINETIGSELLNLSIINQDDELFGLMKNHSSDLVRCWATYFIGKNDSLNISETLEKIQSFAADKHFGVREISWLSVRSKITENLSESIKILTSWTSNSDENIRRFCTESTRPRGVWCSHIDILKHEPEMALSLLEPLKSDSSKYVQNSVGNWLNDASKTRPDFVIKLTEKWQSESKTKETNYIISKALRTINK